MGRGRTEKGETEKGESIERERQEVEEKEKEETSFSPRLLVSPLLQKRLFSFFFFFFSFSFLSLPVLEAVELPAGVSDLDACCDFVVVVNEEGVGGQREREQNTNGDS